VQNLRELLEDMPFPLREVCTLDDIRQALKKKGMRWETPKRLVAALKSLDCQPLGQSRLSHGKVSLWALQRADYWQAASHERRREAHVGAFVDPPEKEEAA
jgi:hypothetical protein